ncbi:MAG: hypothetical protein ACU0CO_18525 [Shimia sp.]
MTDFPRRPVVERPVVSDLDGTREGGLAFVIALVGGMIAAVSVHPAALASMVVWVGLLAMAIGVMASVTRMFDRGPGPEE